MKGHTNNPNGRPKGVPNKASAEIRKMLRDFVLKHWDGFIKTVEGLPDKEKLAVCEKLLPYVVPRLVPEPDEEEGTEEPKPTRAELVKEYLSRLSTEELLKMVDEGREAESA